MATSISFSKAYHVTGSAESYTIGAEITQTTPGATFDISDDEDSNGTALINSTATDGLINVADTDPSDASMSSGTILGYRSSDNGVVISGHNGTSNVTIFFTNSAHTNGDTVTLNFTAGIYTYCFLAGTHIATPTGEVAVETLAVGDEICTINGGVAKGAV